MDVKPRLPIEELKRLERNEKNADRARRLRIVILAIEGLDGPSDRHGRWALATHLSAVGLSL